MLKILIIDDDSSVRNMLKIYLTEECDCWVDLANNVKNGLIACQRKQYDVVFFDYLYLGGGDGFEFLSEVKKCSTVQHPAILVMISGYMKTMDDIRDRGIEILPDEFVKKPFSADAIKDILHRHFEPSRFQKNANE